MFFRRMFQRKGTDTDDNCDSGTATDETLHYIENSTQPKLKLRNIRTHRESKEKREIQLHRSGAVTSTPRTAHRRLDDISSMKHCSSASSTYLRGVGSNTSVNIGATNNATGMQLTPLWEHILRTRTLPDHICPLNIFMELLERLKNPEWQVRQHALRVFVDVLVVMGSAADSFMNPMIGQLVENLGHPAPTIRKGALDCIRVYLAESAMPENILLQILDIGLNQKVTNEPFGGRVTCGVMLSLPALIQSTLHTTKRRLILRTTIDLLVQKMEQITHQEITLKVLSKIRELIGKREFKEILSIDTFQDFELLCRVYGIHSIPQSASTSAPVVSENEVSCWRAVTQYPQKDYYYLENNWSISDEEQIFKRSSGDKVILETEIKINDDTLTMRILEAKDDDDTDSGAEKCTEKSVDHQIIRKEPINSIDLSSSPHQESMEDEIICGRIISRRNSTDSDNGNVVKLLSDSEDSGEVCRRNRERNNHTFVNMLDPSTPSRNPKRVTFGGEIIKMRTPDSDATSVMSNQIIVGKNQRKTTESGETSKITITNSLCLEIPNDNTKPLDPYNKFVQIESKPTLEGVNESEKQAGATQNSRFGTPYTSLIMSPSDSLNVKRKDSSNTSFQHLTSPRSTFKRLNMNSAESIISPKAPHKEIEVLHNLQRDPSPVRIHSDSLRSLEDINADAEKERDSESEKQVQQKSNDPDGIAVVQHKDTQMSKEFQTEPPQPPPRSWEDLGLVTDDILMDLRSGDWRFRLRGFRALEETLRSSDNLARVQPFLDSLLRVLLSPERRAEVAEDKRRLLINLISRLPLDNLEDRTLQIMTGLCRQGGDGANRVCKALMQHLPPAVIVLKLISAEFLHAKSSRFREHALQLVTYALMTFPSTCFDTATCITNATFAALDRKKRVRQAALDVLAVLGQVTSARNVLNVAQRVAVAAAAYDSSALMAAIKACLARKQLPQMESNNAERLKDNINSDSNNSSNHINTNIINTSNTIAPEESDTNASDVERITGMTRFLVDADVDWINAGVGSVSPTSMRRRAQKLHRRSSSSSRQSFYCLSKCKSIDPTPPFGGCSGCKGAGCEGCSNYCEENCKRLNRCSGKELRHQSSNKQSLDDTNQPHNIPYILGSSAPFHFGIASKKYHADFESSVSRRLVAKSCSDSSIEGRSSDSTYTSRNGGVIGGGIGDIHNRISRGSNSNGIGGAIPAIDAQAGGAGGEGEGGKSISGRLTSRQTVHSRFPTMDLNATYVRPHKPTNCYPGMGAYAQLQQQQYNINSMQSKANYTVPLNGTRRRHPSNARQQIQLQQQQQHQQEQQKQLQHQRTYCLNSQDNFIKQREYFLNEKSNNGNKFYNIDKHCNHNGHTSINNNTSNNILNREDKDLDATYTIYSNSSKCGNVANIKSNIISTASNNNNNSYHRIVPQQTNKTLQTTVSNEGGDNVGNLRSTNIGKITTKSRLGLNCDAAPIQRPYNGHPSAVTISQVYGQHKQDTTVGTVKARCQDVFENS